MTTKIYAALPQDFIQRMRNWARASLGAIYGGGNLGVYQGDVIRDPWADKPIPVLIGDAQSVEDALVVLPERYRWAVQEFWSREGRSLREHARGRMIHHTSMEIWIMTGHDLLRAELAKRRELSARIAREHALMARSA